MSATYHFPQGPFLDDTGNITIEWYTWLQNPSVASIIVGSAIDVISGGTGLTSGTSGGILGFVGTEAMASSSLLTNHAIVIGGGAGHTPSTPVGLGTTHTVLHGNATGNPSYGAVALSTDVSGTLQAGQFPALIGDVTTAAGFLTTTLATVATPGTHTKITFNAKGLVTAGASAVLASADYANQGTIHTLLHGNASGNPSWAAVDLTTEVTGILPIANGGTGTSSYKPPVYLFTHFTDQGNGTTVETDLYSDAIAAGQLATNGDKLEIEYGGVFVSSATATRELKLYFGGTIIFDSGALTLSLSSGWSIYTSIIRVSATVIRYMVSMTTEGAALAAYTSAGEITGLDLTMTNIAKITGQAGGVGAATNDIVAKLGSIVYRPF